MTILPLRVSKNQSSFVVDLLLLNDMGRHHYVVLRDLNKKLVSKLQKKKTEIEKHAVSKLLPPVSI